MAQNLHFVLQLVAITLVLFICMGLASKECDSHVQCRDKYPNTDKTHCCMDLARGTGTCKQPANCEDASKVNATLKYSQRDGESCTDDFQCKAGENRENYICCTDETQVGQPKYCEDDSAKDGCGDHDCEDGFDCKHEGTCCCLFLNINIGTCVKLDEVPLLGCLICIPGGARKSVQQLFLN